MICFPNQVQYNIALIAVPQENDPVISDHQYYSSSEVVYILSCCKPHTSCTCHISWFTEDLSLSSVLSTCVFVLPQNS